MNIPFALKISKADLCFSSCFITRLSSGSPSSLPSSDCANMFAAYWRFLLQTVGCAITFTPNTLMSFPPWSAPWSSIDASLLTLNFLHTISGNVKEMLKRTNITFISCIVASMARNSRHVWKYHLVALFNCGNWNRNYLGSRSIVYGSSNKSNLKGTCPVVCHNVKGS